MSWFTIACQLIAGIMCLALAISKATIYWDLTERHDDALLLVGFAAVGGLSLGVALTGIKRRVAAQD